MSGRYADHVVWITGAGSGIGRALALEFVRQGAKVAVSGRRVERLRETVDALEAMGGVALAVPCDVRKEAQVQRAASQVVDHFGRLDVAVANAGFGVSGPIESLTADDWTRQFGTNVVGAASTARSALPFLRKTQGRIALVCSVSGQLALPGAGAYSASKYALRAIGQTLSMELRGSGVSCTTLHPGFVESEIGQVDNEGQFDGSRSDPRPSKLMWPADKAARAMVRAITRRKVEYVFTWHGKFGAWMGRHLPAVVRLVVRAS